MEIQVSCPACGARFRTRAANAGRQAKCRRCGAILEIPRQFPEEPSTVAGNAPPTAPAAVADQAREVSVKKSVSGGSPPGTVSAVPPLLSETQAGELARPGLSSPPSSGTSGPPPRHEAMVREILSSLPQSIEPVHLPAGYRLGIALVAVVMVLLPLVYVALIGLVGYGTYRHAVENTGLLNPGRSGTMRAAMYFGPIVAGVVAVFFMVKPLLARPAQRTVSRPLSRDDEPLLFAFVERLGTAIGAPAPRRIDANCEVNASASFRHGLWSLFSTDLVLTIGMPLAAGLNLRQFAGVLAHEFGHFTQGAGMRMSYLVRSISWWFTRVVYERDVWDERLVRWSQSGAYQVMLVLWLARSCVWLTRRILWGLMIVGHAVAGFLLRQMEFHADLHEARLAGCDSFEQTMRKLAVLSVAHSGAMSDLAEFFKEGRLGDNLPRLILANVDQIPPEIHAKIDEMNEQSKTGWFDTHPSAPDRIAAVQRDGAPGVFRLEYPASVLFTDFDALARQVTEDYYREALGSGFDPSSLHPVASLLAQQAEGHEALKVARRYFQAHLAYTRSLRLVGDVAAPPASSSAAAALVKSARQQMLEAEPGYRQAWEAFNNLESDAVDAEIAAALLRAGVTPRADQFRLPMQNANQLSQVRESLAQRYLPLEAQLKPFEEASRQRLRAALQLACLPEVASRIPAGPTVPGKIARILPALQLVASQTDRMRTLRNVLAGLAGLIELLEARRKNQTFVDGILHQSSQVHACLVEIRNALAAGAYPFEHAKGPCSLADYILPALPDSEDLAAVFHAAGEVVQTLPDLYFRMMGELARVAEQVESLLGLAPLPDPPEEPAT